MAENEGRETVIEELEAALETEEGDEKNYHIRQALQHLELNGEGGSDWNAEN